MRASVTIVRALMKTLEKHDEKFHKTIIKRFIEVCKDKGLFKNKKELQRTLGNYITRFEKKKSVHVVSARELSVKAKEQFAQQFNGKEITYEVEEQLIAGFTARSFDTSIEAHAEALLQKTL